MWMAHNQRLPRPSWLTSHFQPAGTAAITVDGRRMDLFVRQAPASRDPDARNKWRGDANMYVFVK